MKKSSRTISRGAGKASTPMASGMVALRIDMPLAALKRQVSRVVSLAHSAVVHVSGQSDSVASAIAALSGRSPASSALVRLGRKSAIVGIANLASATVRFGGSVSAQASLSGKRPVK
jgi:hypothetical protein